MYTKSPCIRYTVGTATCTIPVFTRAADIDIFMKPKGVLNITVGNATYYSPLGNDPVFTGSNPKINGGYPYAYPPGLHITYDACTVKIIGGCGVVSNTTYYKRMYLELLTTKKDRVSLRCDVCIYFYNGNTATCTYIGKIPSGCTNIVIADQTVPFNTSNKICFFSTTSPSAWRSISLTAKQPTCTNPGTWTCCIRCCNRTDFDSYMWD